MDALDQGRLYVAKKLIEKQAVEIHTLRTLAVMGSIAGILIIGYALGKDTK
jgi:hypothetical protein